MYITTSSHHKELFKNLIYQVASVAYLPLIYPLNTENNFLILNNVVRAIFQPVRSYAMFSLSPIERAVQVPTWNF